MPAPELTFALVLPTLNEIEGLKLVLPKIDRSLFKEIVVVDGGSTDGTVEFCRANGLGAVLTQPGVGLPDAEEQAFAHTTSDAIVVFTPDGNSLPELLPAMCETLAQGYDMVVASRYRGGAKSDDDDFLTRLGNRAFTMMVRILFWTPVTDVLVALRAYRREALALMGLPQMSQESWLRRRFFWLNSWELGSSIRAARLDLRVTEIPGDEPLRVGGVRKLSIVRNGLGALLQILGDFFFFRPSPRPRPRAS